MTWYKIDDAYYINLDRYCKVNLLKNDRGFTITGTRDNGYIDLIYSNENLKEVESLLKSMFFFADKGRVC